MSLTRARNLAGLTLLAATAVFLTACGPNNTSGSAATGSPRNPAGSPAAAGRPKKAPDGPFEGTLSYVASGQLLVGQRMFWVAEDTDIPGSGGLCGDGKGHSLKPCIAAHPRAP